LGDLESLADLAWAAALLRSQARLRELRSIQALSEWKSVFAERIGERNVVPRLSDRIAFYALNLI
jgi:hypothetical protein